MMIDKHTIQRLVMPGIRLVVGQLFESSKNYQIERESPAQCGRAPDLESPLKLLPTAHFSKAALGFDR
jgi:hypothetical protein